MSETLQSAAGRIAIAIAGVLLLAWGSWATVSLLSIPSDLRAIQFNLQALQSIQSNTIPPVVEASLRELREKGNTQISADRETLAKLTETAINNAKDIGYLKEQVATQRRTP